MGKISIGALRAVIAFALLGSVAVQALIVPLLWLDLAEDELWGRVLLVSLVVLGVGTMQVFAVCVWMLLNRVGRGSIFSESSFRYVNVIVDIDVMMARRKMGVGELAELIGITPTNLSVLKNGRAKAVRFTTLDALCAALECQPGDLLRWEPGAVDGEHD